MSAPASAAATAAPASAAPAGLASSGGEQRQRSHGLTPKRVLAMLVLPASLLPVTLLGPGLLRAPRRLARQSWAGVVRLERELAPGRPRVSPAVRPLARVDFGRVYGGWRAFPQVGREGIIPLGPLQ